MKLNVKALAIICFLSVFVLTGCWNYREIDELSIVAGFAVDKETDGQYLLSIEIVTMSAGKDSKMQSNIVQTRGETLFSAIRNSISVTAPRLYWSHCPIAVISEKAAREGLSQIIDFILRDAEMRTDMTLLVSQMETAYEVINTKSITSDIRAYELENMLKDEKYLSKTPQVKIYEFYNAMAGEGISAVLPAVNVIKIHEDKTSQLNGMAIFDRDKLAGYLSQEETFYYQYIKDELTTGIIPLKIYPDAEKSQISFEIFENNTQVKPSFKNGELCMEIGIRTEVNIGENGTSIDYYKQDEQDLLKKKLEETIKSNIETVIHRVQTHWGLDIFGFGSKVQGDMQKVWQKFSKDWKFVFTNLKIKVNVEVEIRNSAHVQRPLKIGD